MERPVPPLSAHWHAFVALLLAFAVLGATLAVYPTSLNPGLPILLGAALAAAVGFGRLVWGCGPYYHWGIDAGSLLLLIAVVSNSLALDTYLAQRSLFSLVGAVGFLLLPAVVIRSSRDWRILAYGFVTFATVVCLLAWPAAIESALQTGTLPYLMGTFVNQDTFSVLPLLALTLGLGLATSVRQAYLVPYCAQLVVLFGSLFATGCRAAILALFIGVATFLIAVLAHRGAKHRESLKVLLVLPFLCCLLALPFSDLGFTSAKKLTAAASGDAFAREETRREVYTLAWRAALDRPFLGAGPGCFGLAFQSVRAPEHDRLYVNIAHNDHLEVLVELGTLGFLAWLALILACCSKCYSLVRSSRRPILAGTSLGAVVAAVVFALFNFIWVARPVLWAEFFVLGMALSLPSRRLVVREPKAARYLFAVGLVVVAGFAASFGHRSMKAEGLLAEASQREAALELERAMQLLEQAIALQPERSSVRLDHEQLQKTWAAMYPAATSYEERAQNLQAARASSPTNISVLLALADFELQQGNEEKVKEALDTALRYAPYHWAVRDKRLAIAIQTGDLATAVELALGETASDVRTRRLTTLLLSLEAQTSGAGTQRWATFARKDERAKADAAQLLESILAACGKSAQWKLGVAFAGEGAKMYPEDLCLVWSLADFYQRDGRPDQAWRALDDKMSTTEPARDECYEKLILAWADLAQSRNPKGLEARLVSDLRLEPRLLKVRVLLSQLLTSQGDGAAALKLAREGLDYKEDSPELLAEIGRLYEDVGSKDLALSYYQRALKLRPKDRDIASKIRALSEAR